jgi:glutaredoxin 2
MFEHCSLCFRVRMTATLEGIHLRQSVVLEDDSDAMARLVGKRVIKGIRFPRRVRDYFETMMSRIGFEPLPAI